MTQVNERDLIASGNPPEAPALPQSEAWVLVEGWEQSGIEARWLKGKKQYRATALIDDPRFPGEKGPVYSAIFKACDEADAGRVEGYVINPAAAQYQLDLDAGIARSHMKSDQAAMSDMRRVLKTLENDLLFPYNQWMQRNARHVTQLHQSDDLRAQVAMMVSDIEEFGLEPEYTTFIEQLGALLSRKSE
jgi:hypothetical protein